MSKPVHEPAVYSLKFPVDYTTQVSGQEAKVEKVDILRLRVPKAADMRAADGHEGQTGKTIAMIAHLSGYPVSVIDKLEIADFLPLAEIVGGFLNGGPTTGETSLVN